MNLPMPHIPFRSVLTFLLDSKETDAFTSQWSTVLFCSRSVDLGFIAADGSMGSSVWDQASTANSGNGLQ